MIFDTRRRFTKNLKRPGHVPERIWGPSWAQPGSQNRPKIDLGPKKGRFKSTGARGRRRRRGPSEGLGALEQRI